MRIAPGLNHKVPAEPLSDSTAKLALEFNIVFAVFWTVFDWDLATVGTDQFLRFEVCLTIIHCILAGLSASEVGVFTFEALIIGENC